MAVVNRGGSLLSNPGRTVRELYIVIGAQRVLAPDLTANPVLVPLTTVGQDGLIDQDDSTQVTIGVSIRDNPREDEIRLRIPSGGVIVKDASSGQLLEVVDKATQQPINGRFISHPLVILSNQFQEYVHNYPNPFSPGLHGATHITYFLDTPGSVEVKIYSLLGELVYERSVPAGDALAAAGPHEIDWDARNMKGEMVRNGIYVCKLVAGSKSATFRIAVAK